jgi:hypothetical protein
MMNSGGGRRRQHLRIAVAMREWGWGCVNDVECCGDDARVGVGSIDDDSGGPPLRERRRDNTTTDSDVNDEQRPNRRARTNSRGQQTGWGANSKGQETGGEGRKIV